MGERKTRFSLVLLSITIFLGVFSYLSPVQAISVDPSSYFEYSEGSTLNFNSSQNFTSIHYDLDFWFFDSDSIKTMNGNVSVTSWFVSYWLNYTVSEISSQQQIDHGSKPVLVYIDGFLAPEGSGWSYSGTTVTIFPTVSANLKWAYVYVPFPIDLSISGNPELNYDVLINGSAFTTPYDNVNYTSGNSSLSVENPSVVVGHFIYTFSHWVVNGTTNITSSSFIIDLEGNTTISLVFSKAIRDIAFDRRNIASEIVHLADTGEQLGKMLGVNSFIGGLIMSAIICAIFLFPVMVFKRTLLPMVIMGFLSLAISTGLGFIPFWIDLVLLLIVAVLFSGKIRDYVTGAGN